MNEIQKTIIDKAAEHHAAGGDPARAVRIAVMNHIEDRLGSEGVIVGYGDDEELSDARDVPDDWYQHFPPVEDATRFRVFYPREFRGGNATPEEVVDVMHAIGSTWIGVFDEQPDVAGTYERRGKLAAHFVLPDDAPIVLAVGKWLSEEREQPNGHTIA